MIGRNIGAQTGNHALGVPLHAQNGQRAVFQRFDQSVGGVGCGAQTVPELSDRLMVVTAHFEEPAGQTGGMRASDGCDRVGNAVVTGDFLEQRSAEGDVDHLHAAADTQDRFAQGTERTQQRQFFGVTDGVERQPMRLRYLTVKRGLRIAAAR